MRILLYACILLTTMLVLTTANACDWKTGERNQHVFLSWNGETLHDWVAPMGSLQQVNLPNGFELGIELNEPPRKKYNALAERIQHVPEMVQINLFDMEGDEPELLSETYGGTNSIQGFGASGGANRVEQLGDPGIRLTLLKPVCAEPAAVAVGQ